MFQFPGFALKTLCIQVKSTWLCSLLIAKLTITNIQVGSPIRKSWDQRLFSPPPSLSQSITSFIASYCQGIHQTPFSRLICSRKSQTCVCNEHAGSHVLQFLNKSHKFTFPTLPKKCLVSVLDLEQHCRFMSGYIRAVEEKTGSKCLPVKQEPTRDHLLTYKDQQCY